MAMTPPGVGPGPGAPGAPASPGMSPQAAPPGGPPPLGGMPPPRPMGPGPASPFAFVFSDLPSEMSGGWQMLDGVVRMLKLALKSPDFAKTPNIVAVLTSELETLTQLISHYTSKGDRASVPTGTAPQSSERSEDTDSRVVSADADTVPDAEME